MGVNEENGYYKSLINIKAWSHVGSYLAYLCYLLLTFMHHVAWVLMSSTSRICQASLKLTLHPRLIKASTVHLPSLGFYFWKLYFMFMIMHLSVGV
jgi:hypothetical protein